MKSCAVIAAAGSGSRMGGVSKPNIVIAEKTLFEYVLGAFGASCVGELVVVCSEDNETSLRTLASGFEKPICFVRGGKTRAESVFLGVCASSKDASIICTHDCARPFISPETINKAVNTAIEKGASCVCAPVTDTVKIKNADGTVSTPDRSRLFAVQTPQCFKKELYLSAKALSGEAYLSFTDETSLLEAGGYAVEYIINSENNMKLTSKSDVPLAEAIMKNIIQKR